MSESEPKWHVGQRVWCLHHGEGFIQAVDESAVYPVWVKFDGGHQGYKLDGRLCVSDSKRSLYMQPMKLTPEPWPIEYKHDEVILVRDLSYDQWKPRYFKEVRNGEVYAYLAGKTSITSEGDGRKWKHHRKYDENLAWKKEGRGQ